MYLTRGCLPALKTHLEPCTKPASHTSTRTGLVLLTLTDLHFGNGTLLKTCPQRRERSKATTTRKLFYVASVSEQPCLNVCALSSSSRTEQRGDLQQGQGFARGSSAASPSLSVLARERKERGLVSAVPRGLLRGEGHAGTLGAPGCNPSPRDIR